jgi:Mce-associated membrane protein
MPPRPRTPRPRATTARRPRVAGVAPTATRPDTPARPAATPEEPPAGATETTAAIPTTAPTTESKTESTTAPASEPAPAERPRPKVRRPRPEGERGDAEAPPAGRPAGKRSGAGRATADPVPTRKAPQDAQVHADGRDDAPDDTADSGADVAAETGGIAATLRRHAVPLLVTALVVLTAAAAVFGVLDARLRGTPAATNLALVDVGATAEASGQLGDAIETVYSFDFARLDENENAARAVITPEFAAEFDRLFAEVRARAPEQQAVVSATVTTSAVKELTADRAVLVAFVDQQATRAAPDAESQQLAAAGRLTVTGEKVDGRWKIATVTPL